MVFPPAYRLRFRAGFCLPVLLAIVLATGACSSLPGVGARSDESSVQVGPGVGTVRLVQGSETKVLSGPHPLFPGDQVQAADDGLARLTGPSGTLEFWGGSLQMISASRFRLNSGHVLVRGRSPMRIDTRLLRISAFEGVFRVDRGLATRIGSYSGDPVKVRSRSGALEVQPYRQVVTVQGVLPKVVQPLRFSAADRWDRRLLSDAIDLDTRVSNFAQGLEAQLGKSEGVDFFSRVAPGGIAVESLRPFSGSRRSDLLIGLAMAAEAKKLGELGPEDRFTQIFELWNQGATWGLLAQEFGVGLDLLFAQLTQAIERAQIQLIGPGPGLSKPPAAKVQVPARRAPVARAPRPSASGPGVQTAPRSSDPALLREPVSGAVPAKLKTIVNEVYGVVDPVTGLPPVL